MIIKLKFIKIQLELLRSTLHILLNFRKPTDKIVIYCSQQLDEIIVKYYKVKVSSDNLYVHYNRSLLNNTLSSISKPQISQDTGTDKTLNLQIDANMN